MSSNNQHAAPDRDGVDIPEVSDQVNGTLRTTLTDLELAVVMKMNSAPDERLEEIWRFYEQQTGSSLHRPVTPQEREQISAWMLDRRGATHESFEIRANHLWSLAHRTPGEKANSLVQTTCGGCELLMDGDRFVLNATVPIDVEPWSAQSAKNKVVIRDAVRAELQQRGRSAPLDTSFCLTVVAYTPRMRKSKDVDNLVKGLLDSLSGVLYADDRQVQCLTSRRILTNADRGAYLLAARAVHSFEADVVYDDARPLNIVSGSRVAT